MEVVTKCGIELRINNRGIQCSERVQTCYWLTPQFILHKLRVAGHRWPPCVLHLVEGRGLAVGSAAYISPGLPEKWKINKAYSNENK